jgi:hypothetical protein
MFEQYRPAIENLYSLQKNFVTNLLAEARKLIAEGQSEQGGILLLQRVIATAAEDTTKAAIVQETQAGSTGGDTGGNGSTRTGGPTMISIVVHNGYPSPQCLYI